MKTLIYQLILILTFTFHFQTSNYAQSYFYNEECGTDFGIGNFCSMNQNISVNVNVSGQPTLGVDNFGLVEVFIDFNTVGSFFNSHFILVDPNGNEFILASSIGFNSSFPNWPGGTAGVSFVPCLAYPQTSNAAASINLETYQPIEDFTRVNDDMINPNGTWQIKPCVPTSDDVPFNIFCVRLFFDNICTEATNVIVNNPDCPGGEAEVLFDVNPGICPGIWASLDNVTYESFDDLDGNRMLTSDALVNTLFVDDSQPGTEGDSDCSPTETPISIMSADTEDPTFDCPINQTISMGDNCENAITIMDPIIIDNCGNVSGIAIYNVTGSAMISSDEFNLILGNAYSIEQGSNFTYSLTGVGSIEIDWTANDDAGNSTTCKQIITLEDNTPPLLTSSSIIIPAECGVDDIDQVVASNISQLTGNDNCGEVNLVLDENSITNQCGLSQYNDWYYYLVDDNGNQTSTRLGILVDYLDNLAPEIIGLSTADITINCNEELPPIPQIGVNVFSNDACQGDLTDDMTLTTSSIFGDCLAGQPQEVITYLYTSIDVCGNEATESFSITIMNDVAPVFDAPFDNGSITIAATCGVDNLDAIIAANIPTASGCNGATTISLVSQTIGDLCDAAGGSIPASNTQIVYQAEDDCGNTALVGITIDYYDFIPPVINGIPASITLNCEDSPPAFPNVTANDACAGEVTDLIEYNLDISSISCSINQNAFVETHTWTATDYCGNIQVATWTVTIFNDEAVELGNDITACTGETVVINSSGLSGDYIWSTGETTSGITVASAGTYSVTVTGESGCCSEDNITILYQDFPDATATGGTLDCSGDDIILMGSSTTSGVSYTWFGPGGFNSTQQNPSVNQAGVYTLSVTTTAGCVTSDETIVEADTDVPDITTNGGTIDCSSTSLTITGSTNTSDVTYSWTGPGGFSSSEQNPIVNIPGDYILIISAPNGCVAEGLAVVIDDTEVPTSTALGGTLDCDNATVALTATSSDIDASFTWTGPNGFSSNLQNPIVSAAGTYSLSVISDNGCSSNTSTIVEEDIAVPDLLVAGGTIDCNNSEIQITSSSSTIGVTYQWTGPNGYSSTIANPTVELAGEYTITIEASNGCTSAMSVTVEEDLATPTVSVDSKEINCTNTDVTLMPDATEGVTFAWTGPAGFTSTDENPEISEPGEYIVEVTAENGCTATTNVTVTEDTSDPDVTVADGTIDCTSPMIDLSLTTTTDDVTFAWTGPNGFSSEAQNPEVDVAGNYIVTTTGLNGCSVQNTVAINEDLAIPDISVVGGEINCDANTVQIMGSSTTADVTYGWTGPNDFSTAVQNPNVGSPGIYTLTVTGANGCMITDTVEVTADENLPNISASGGTLDCNTFEVTLMGSSTTEGVTFAWTGPDNFASTVQNPTVSNAGIYTLTVKSENGCASETEVSVALDDSEPAVIALGGVISCSLSSIILVGNSNDEVTYAWSGPGGYESEEQNPEATLPGEYTLTVTGTNGCTNSTTVEVEVDEDLPVATLGLPTVDCDENSVTITLETTEEYAYSWTYNESIISTNESVTISEAGNYSVIITADNGCTVTLSYTLEQDVEALTADISTTDATSSIGGTAEIEVSNPDAVIGILWDNGQTGDMATDLMVGTHTVTVTDFLGCTYTYTFEVLMSTAVYEIDILEDFIVYPTMAQDYINLEATLSKSQTYSIQIIDVQGRQITKKKFKSASLINERISIDDFSNGVYIISLSIGNETKTTKFIKM